MPERDPRKFRGIHEGRRAGTEYKTSRSFLSSLFSLLSGASIGPEGTIATMVSQIAIWIRTKVRIVRIPMTPTGV